MKTKLYFEILGNQKEPMQGFMNKIIEKIKEFKDIKIEEIKTADIIETEREFLTPDDKKIKAKVFSSYIEVKAEFESLSKFIDFVLYYSPSRIEFEDLKEVIIRYKDKEEKVPATTFSNIINLISNKIIDLSLLNLNLAFAYNELLKKVNENQPK